MFYDQFYQIVVPMCSFIFTKQKKNRAFIGKVKSRIKIKLC